MENLRTINSTLLLIQKEGKILLGEKKRGFAKGTLNGIGGKQDFGENIDQAMVRETQEEIGVTPIDYVMVGKIAFDVWNSCSANKKKKKISFSCRRRMENSLF